MPDISHKAAENTEALFSLCDLRASVPLCGIIKKHTKPQRTRRTLFFSVISVPLCGIIKKNSDHI